MPPAPRFQVWARSVNSFGETKEEPAWPIQKFSTITEAERKKERQAASMKAVAEGPGIGHPILGAYARGVSFFVKEVA